MAVKVLLFGDVGIDDTVALIYGFFKEEVEIVAVVADYGNVSRNQAVHNVHYLSHLFHKEQTKIISGAEGPLSGEQPSYAPEIHGKYGLGPIVPPDVSDNMAENFFEIINVIEKYRDELVVVNIGRLTALATMFILYREKMQAIKSYYMMGGAFWAPGNITAVSEANFNADPVAAETVLKHADNVTIVPLDVTEKAIVTPEMVDYIAYKGKAKIVKPLLDFYYHSYKKRNPSIQGSPVHDALTIMASIHEEMLGFRKLPVKIVQQQEGISKGQSIVDTRPYSDPDDVEGREHRIAITLDYPMFYKELMSVMTDETF